MATDLTSTSTTTMDDLPEGILLRILSFLPAIDAISTTSVSSKWRHLWLSSPTLDFCIVSFASRFNLCHLSSEIRHLFAKFITRVLFLRIHNSSPLNKFQLSFDYRDYDCRKDYVDNWILFAVIWKCKVLILYLQNDEYSDGRPDEDDDEAMTLINSLEETDDQTTSDDERNNNSNPESDEESRYALCGEKVSISKEIFSENFAFNNLKYLKLLTGFQKREVLGLELCLEMCPKLETLVLENWSREDVDDDDLIEMEESNAIILQIQKLRQVELIKYKGTRNEVYVVDLLKKHKAVLENILAFPATENEMPGKPTILWTSSVK